MPSLRWLPLRGLRRLALLIVLPLCFATLHGAPRKRIYNRWVQLPDPQQALQTGDSHPAAGAPQGPPLMRILVGEYLCVFCGYHNQWEQFEEG